MGINTHSKTYKNSKKDSNNNCTKNSKNEIDNSQPTKRRKTNIPQNSANLRIPLEELDNRTKNSKNGIDNLQPIKHRKINILPNSAISCIPLKESAITKGNNIIESESNLDNQPVAMNSNLNVTNNLLRYMPKVKIQEPCLSAASKKLKCIDPNPCKKSQRSSPDIVSLDTDDNDTSNDTSDDTSDDTLNNTPDNVSDDTPNDTLNNTPDNAPDDTLNNVPNISKDIPDDDTFENDSHQNSLTYKPKFVLRYSPDLMSQEHILHSYETNPVTFHSNLNKPIHLDNSINHAIPDMLAILVNEAKIMFLRARNPPPAACSMLVKLVAPGFAETSKTTSFLKSKLNAYYADYRSRLNTEARAYAEDYINNNNITTLNNVPNIEDLGSYVDDMVIFQCLKNPIAQVTESWWEGDHQDSVDAFRMFIASAIRIHIINVLKCKDDPHISNTSALNEVKALDYITRDIHLPHYNTTNHANSIDLNLFETSTNYRSHGRGRGRGRGCGRMAMAIMEDLVGNRMKICILQII
ncbi:hypothetical protein GLOIN_2v1881169 [Rhizophagus clarus]|uniref:Uncharacterized protein n=1 Tax=Rhizophagus clarus TaxID=94130 RepID=A0A8H3R1S0_9GLOM|nr:hypothetical protein GLOIN_2v1881169 [Rhizophagus clarus]